MRQREPDEAEMLRRMRRAGLQARVRAWLADGRTNVVTRYSVAERPPG